MKKAFTLKSNYFCGNKVSDYGIENGRVDYATLAKSFDAVLNNEIMGTLENQGFYFEQENGFIDNTDEIEELQDKITELENEIDILSDEIFYIDDVDFENEQAKLDKIEELEEKKRVLDDQREELEQEKEELENEQDEQPEIFQFFIISDNGARILKDYTNEIVFYCDSLDMYIWGVTHYGTSWDYVLTNIEIEPDFKD